MIDRLGWSLPRRPSPPHMMGCTWSPLTLSRQLPTGVARPALVFLAKQAADGGFDALLLGGLVQRVLAAIAAAWGAHGAILGASRTGGGVTGSQGAVTVLAGLSGTPPQCSSPHPQARAHRRFPHSPSTGKEASEAPLGHTHLRKSRSSSWLTVCKAPLCRRSRRGERGDAGGDVSHRMVALSSGGSSRGGSCGAQRSIRQSTGWTDRPTDQWPCHQPQTASAGLNPQGPPAADH